MDDDRERRRRPRAARLALALAAIAVGLALLVAGGSAQPAGGVAYSIELDGTVDPATERWLAGALDDAADGGAELAIVRLDTPGGLDSSMREMVQRIIAAPLPVVVYVSPDGARAASAGLFLVQAGDVAAMAPQTNIGSATPVQIGGGEQDEVMGRKVRNDAAAYIRALAEGHGRNADLAERMVRDAVNVTAERALDADLIDVMAADEQALLDELDGFEIQGPKAQTLATEGLRVERHSMPFGLAALQVLVNPTVAALLLVIGLAGLAIEIFSPGGIVPGVGGGIALILGLVGTAQLPVTVAGVLLLLLAIGLLAAETQVASGGVLGVGGIAALVAGILVLYDTDSEAYGVSVPAAVAAGVVLGGLVLLAASKGLAARSAPARGGPEELIGQSGEVRRALEPEGQIHVAGALWRARADPDGGAIAVGEAVRVKAVEGLRLMVERADRTPTATGEADAAAQSENDNDDPKGVRGR